MNTVPPATQLCMNEPSPESNCSNLLLKLVPYVKDIVDHRLVDHFQSACYAAPQSLERYGSVNEMYRMALSTGRLSVPRSYPQSLEIQASDLLWLQTHWFRFDPDRLLRKDHENVEDRWSKYSLLFLFCCWLNTSRCWKTWRDEVTGYKQAQKFVNLDHLEIDVSDLAGIHASPWADFWDYCYEDPELELHKQQVRKCMTLNYHVIFVAIYPYILGEYPSITAIIQELARTHKITYPKLSSEYHRKFLPFLKQLAIDGGWKEA